MNLQLDVPKAPRWITTEAGQWAWEAHTTWRSNASNAMYVRHRSELLSEAEQMWSSQNGDGAAEQEHGAFGD